MTSPFADRRLFAVDANREVNREADLPTVRRDFSPEDFPITISCFRTDNDELVWKRTVTIEEIREHGPKAIFMPPLVKEHGVPIWTRVEFGDGTTSEHRPIS